MMRRGRERGRAQDVVSYLELISTKIGIRKTADPKSALFDFRTFHRIGGRGRERRVGRPVSGRGTVEERRRRREEEGGGEAELDVLIPIRPPGAVGILRRLMEVKQETTAAGERLTATIKVWKYDEYLSQFGARQMSLKEIKQEDEVVEEPGSTGGMSHDEGDPDSEFFGGVVNN